MTTLSREIPEQLRKRLDEALALGVSAKALWRSARNILETSGKDADGRIREAVRKYLEVE